jgi:hypothetical protein
MKGVKRKGGSLGIEVKLILVYNIREQN